VTDAAGAAVARLDFLHHLEVPLLDRDKPHLCNAFAGLHLVAGLAAIPA